MMKTNSTRRGGASTALTGKGILRVSLALLTAAALLTGCGKSDNDPDPEPKPKPEPEPEATLSISPVVETLTFSAENPETHTFEVTTNQSEWKALSDQDWCKITTDSEKGTFSVTALPNPTTKAPTPATITVSAGKAAPLEIAATQLPVIYDVYLGGMYQLGNGRNVVCYWKNGVRKGLTDPTSYSYCSSTTTSDNSFYIAGVGDGISCYWKDGEKVNVSSFTPEDIAVEKGKIYLLDNMNRYWIDGEEGNTPSSSAQGFTARFITASEGTVYVAGQVSITLIGKKFEMAYIWTPGENAVELPEPGGANDSDVTCIVASGGSIYVGGFYLDKETNIQHACYWKDKVCTVLDLPQGTTATSARVDAICVVDGTVYAAGTYSDAGRQACYWVNGTCKKLELPGDNNIYRIAGMAVADGKVYVAGNYFGNGTTCVGYWFDGTWNEMDQEAGVSNMSVYGIAVLKK